MDESFMKQRAVVPLVLSMALPMVFSMMVNALYNIVDSFFVARISEDAMTALSLVYPVQNLVNAVAIGFAVGINAVIALSLGAGNSRRADCAATQGLALAAVHGVVLTVVTVAVMPAFLRMFGATETVLALGTRYGRIALSFSVIINVHLMFEKLFQSVGRMKISMLGLLCGCVSNMILDPLLIFGIGIFPRLGIAGAAIATGLGQTTALIFYLVVYFRSDMNVHITPAAAKPEKSVVGQLYAIGIPATLNLALPSLLVSALNAILATFSQTYILVLGVYYKLQNFLYLTVNGIVQGMRPIIGYNYGAGERERVRKIYRTVLTMSLGIMAFGTVVCMTIPDRLIGLFASDAATIAAGETALRIISLGFIVSSVSVTGCGALEGLGKGMASLVISLCRYALVILPAAVVLSRVMGVNGVWHAFWVAELITAGIAWVDFRRASR